MVEERKLPTEGIRKALIIYSILSTILLILCIIAIVVLCQATTQQSTQQSSLLPNLPFNSSTREDETLKCKDYDIVNNRPIIGILALETTSVHKKYSTKINFGSFIPSSYVKDVESSGARVVPIIVLLPGGVASFQAPNGYADAGQHIFEIAKEMNDAGDYFPIFGICLGFQYLIVLDSGRSNPENRIVCNSYKHRSLSFTNDYRDSKIFKCAPSDVIDVLEHDNVTVNSHDFCIVEENLISHNVSDHWRVSSHSEDDGGLRFIASIEHTRYPFYGIQFRPEKSAFEWQITKKYPSSADAIKANRYFMDFFVNECRKSNHSFKNTAEEIEFLIYKDVPRSTGTLGSVYHQYYLFAPII